MEEVKKWIHKDKFHITGRGDVYTLDLRENGYPDGVDRDKLPEIIPFGSIVEIEGQQWQVKGIESFAVYIVNQVGIMVKPVNHGKESTE